jgi:hypothetical protein
MTNDSSRFSIFAVWEEALAVLRSEWSLVLPVAFSCFGLPIVAAMLVLPAPVMTEVGPQIPPGNWMLILPLVGILFMIGSMAIAGLALQGGVSVHEALERAVRRLPAGIGLYLVNIGLQVVASLAMAPIMLIGSPGDGQPGPYSIDAVALAFVLLIWVYLRMMPVWTLLYRDRQNPLTTIVATWKLTRGHTVRLLLARIVLMLTVFILAFVIVLPAGAIARLLGALSGQPWLTHVLGVIVAAGLLSTIAGVWSVYVAVLTRRLEALSKGT